MDNRITNTDQIKADNNSEQINLPKNPKIKKKYLVSAIFAATLVLVVAAGSFYFVRNLNLASTPNAPASEPQAAAKAPIKSWNGGDNCSQGCGANEYCENGRCRKSGGTGDARDPNEVRAGLGTQPVNTPTRAPLSEYVCTAENCPSPCFHCNASKTSCISNGCAGVSAIGIPGQATATISILRPLDTARCEAELPGCALEDCHCGGGDACSYLECGVNGAIDLRTSCSNQGRSWCVNMTGRGMTCCAAGYDCHPSGKGCSGGSASTPDDDTDTPTATATIPPTTTVTIPPTATITVTPTATPSATITVTPTATPSATVTVEPTIVDCNDRCTADDDCSDGLFCDTESNRCRKPECSTSSSCRCPTATPEPTPVGCNKRCTSDDGCTEGLFCDTESNRCRKPECSTSSSCRCPTARPTETDSPTRRVTRVASQPTILKEAGILDFPGAAVFGSGLLLTVIGILLAL